MPRRKLNARFQAHLRRAERTRAIGASLLVVCVLVGAGVAFAKIACVKDAGGQTCLTRSQVDALLSASAAAGAPSAGSGAPDSDSAVGGVHDAEPPTVTDNRDDTATSSPQLIVPSSISTSTTSTANDNTPPDDTLLVDEPEETPPDVASDVSPPTSAVEAPTEAANDNSPAEELPSTGTE